MTQVPFVSPFSMPVLIDGILPTTACLNDARRDAERRDQKLLEIERAKLLLVEPAYVRGSKPNHVHLRPLGSSIDHLWNDSEGDEI